MMIPTKDGLSSAFELAWASDQTKECCEQFLGKGIALYNSATNKIIEKSAETRAIVIPKKLLNFDGLNHCKTSFKKNELDHYYDYTRNEMPNPLVIEAGKDGDTYSIGKAVKFTKDTSGNLTPINGCKYVIANLTPTTKEAIDLSKFKVYELDELQIEMIMMNNTLSQAIKVPNTKPEHLVCLYDFPNKPSDNLFVFQPKYPGAVKCFNTLEQAGYHIWDAGQHKVAEQRDIQLAKIECGTICKATYWGEAYVDWCKNEFKTNGFHNLYEFKPTKLIPLKIKSGIETDTYSVGIAEQRVNGITKVDGCKYVVEGFNQTMKNVIDLSGLKVRYEDLFFKPIYMNDLPTVAVHVDKTQPTYLFCLLDYNDELIPDNFIFSQNAKPQDNEL
jgi:hypothetical protein